ncbi:MAG: glucosaminidase domain-containing protein [Chloroflexaceae bacterium]|nr:glucosaminidase domain-containing protein [Chloroflexaceae bacterium]
MNLSRAIRCLTIGLFLFTLGILGSIFLPAAWNASQSASVVGAALPPTTRPHSRARTPGEPPLPLPLAQTTAGEFDFLSTPTVSLETYQRVYCQPRRGRVSAACAYAPQMYQLLVDAGIDPAIEMAFAAKETEFGSTGPGRAPQYNLHNIVCNRWDGSTCDGPYHYRFATYANYLHGLNAWIHLLLHSGRYLDAGNRTFRSVLPIYAPPFENNTALYIAQAESWVRGWRSWEGGQLVPLSSPLFWGQVPAFSPPPGNQGSPCPPLPWGASTREMEQPLRLLPRSHPPDPKLRPTRPPPCQQTCPSRRTLWSWTTATPASTPTRTPGRWPRAG